MTDGTTLTRAWGGEAGQRDVWPTERQALLLQAALLRDRRAADAWRQIRPDVDVASLDGATTALLPTLRRNLIAHGVDDELLTLFKGVHRYTWARSQTLMAAVLPAVARLEAEGIPTMLLKGAAFIAKGGVDAGQRAITDVDVLVPTDRRTSAVEVLGRCGFAPMGGAASWYVSDYAPRFTPGYGFADRGDRQIDLHWHVLHGSCQPGADDDFWHASRPVELLGVSTRALAPSDELLHVVVHGLRWNNIPTYRWVVDAALLASGALGTIDYERLVEQAIRRRLSVPVHAGLSYLAEIAESPIPADSLRVLAKAARSRLERLEFRAQMTQPRCRRWSEQALIQHEQYVRRELDLGSRAGVLARLRLERRRLGLRHPLDVRHIRSGGSPGPGRPMSETAAALGTGATDSAAVVPVPGEISFADADALRRHVVYGTWRNEPHGCWIAGRQARLLFGLENLPTTRLALVLSVETPHTGQTLDLIANGRIAASLRLDPGICERLVLLPPHDSAGARRLDLRLRCGRVSTPATEGTADEDRRLGVFLRTLAFLEPVPYEPGVPIQLAAAGDPTARDRPGCLFLSGWYAAEPGGRWTEGDQAALYVHLVGERPPLDLEFDAWPVAGDGEEPVRFEVHAGRRRLARLAWAEPQVRRVRLPLPPGAFERDGGLELRWKIGNPRSPSANPADRRSLGLMLRSVALLHRDQS